MSKKTIEINFDYIDGALSVGADISQCLYILEGKGLKIGPRTLQRRIKEQFNMTFSEYRSYKMSPTKLKLAQTAIKRALDGNTTLMIFCLKNICKWSDNNDSQVDIGKIEITLPDGKLAKV